MKHSYTSVGLAAYNYFYRGWFQHEPVRLCVMHSAVGQRRSACLVNERVAGDVALVTAKLRFSQFMNP